MRAFRLGPPGLDELIARYYGFEDASPDSLIGLTPQQASLVVEYVVEGCPQA